MLDPFQMGTIAALDQRPPTVNPFPAGTFEHDEWLDGWEYGASYSHGNDPDDE